MLTGHADLGSALTDLDHPLKRQARNWAEQALTTGPIDHRLWQRCATDGVLGTILPERWGGRGCSAVEAMLIFEGLGAADTDLGVVFGLAAQTFVTQRALLLAGTDEQKEQWLMPLVRGEHIGCFAMTESHAGSDVAAISTSADVQPDGSYLLNGTKSWVTLGPVSDSAIVFAMTAPELGRWGITAFIVDTHSPEVECRSADPKIGLQSCPFGDLTLHGYRAAADTVLGAVGSGFGLFSRVVEVERAFLYSAQIGRIERLVDLASSRARSRRQFGTHIGGHQAVAHRIADMKLQHEMSRLLLYKTAALYDQKKPVAMAAALTKLQTSLAGPQAVIDAMQVFGAKGYTDAEGFDAHFGDMTGGLSFAGTADVTRNLVAALLGVDRPSTDDRDDWQA